MQLNEDKTQKPKTNKHGNNQQTKNLKKQKWILVK